MRLAVAVIAFSFLATASAQDAELRASIFAAADASLEAAKAADGELLAPTAFGKGMKSYQSAETDFNRGRNLERVRAKLVTATTSFNTATEAAEIAKITLASSIKTRSDAIAANAQRFAAETWNAAEESFKSAATRLEMGNIKSARRKGEEAEAEYRDAELTAIKAQYLSQTKALLIQAERDRVQRYAPKTLAKAEGLLARAEQELNENRYDTDLPRSLAQEANYEARHAIYLARYIRNARKEDISTEDVILAYEKPLQEIAAAADKVAALDQGTEKATAELVSYIDELRDRETALTQDLGDARQRVAGLEEEIRELDDQLGGASQERVALMQRLEAEARIREQFQRVEKMFTRDEARVYRQGNNIIIRLVGLTFASGQSNVEFQYNALLRKVRDAVETFPRSQLVIEGHTDSHGGDEANMALSKQRAQAVASQLIGQLDLAPHRIKSVGFGETQPIANNETAQGRARNRRIDVRIEPDLPDASVASLE